MAQKLNLIWNPWHWVFLAWSLSIFYSMSNFTYFSFKDAPYIPTIPLGSLLMFKAKICQNLKKLNIRILEITKFTILLHVWLKKLSNFDFKSSSVFWPYLMHFFPAPVLNSELQCGSNGKLQWIIGWVWTELYRDKVNRAISTSLTSIINA